jgi:hypothetical protein
VVTTAVLVEAKSVVVVATETVIVTV